MLNHTQDTTYEAHLDTDRLEMEIANLELTKKAFADEVGVTEKTLRKYLKEPSKVNLDQINMIARFIGISPLSIITEAAEGLERD